MQLVLYGKFYVNKYNIHGGSRGIYLYAVNLNLIFFNEFYSVKFIFISVDSANFLSEVFYSLNHRECFKYEI